MTSIPSELAIVTVVLDDPQGLRRTAGSIAEQQHPGFDWIIIDGASGPATQAVLAAIGSRAQRIVSAPDAGIFDAMNKGAALAERDHVLFLNAGDELADPAVVGAIDAYLETDHADIVYGGHLQVWPGGWSREQPLLPIASVLHGMPASHQAMIYRRELLLARPFDLDGHAADWRHLLDCYLDGATIESFDRIVARVDRTGVSQRQWQSSFDQRCAHLQRRGLWTPQVARDYRRIRRRAALGHALERVLPRGLWLRLAARTRRDD